MFGKGLGISPFGRRLQHAEIIELKKVFGESVDYDRIKVRTPVIAQSGWAAAALVPTTERRARRHKRTISFDPSYLKSGRREEKTSPGILLDSPFWHAEVLIHEVMHFWQLDQLGPEEMNRRYEIEEGISEVDPYDLDYFIQRGISFSGVAS